MTPRQQDRIITVPRSLNEQPPFDCGQRKLIKEADKQLRPLDLLIAGVLIVGAAAFAYDIHALGQLLRAFLP